MNANIISHVIN